MTLIFCGFIWPLAAILIRVFLGVVDPEYDRNCEKEPIGKELFRLFCETNAKFKEAIDFLDCIVSNAFYIHPMLNCRQLSLGFWSFNL